MARSIEEIAARIRPTPTQAVFGAFDGKVLVGITGVGREPLCQVSGPYCIHEDAPASLRKYKLDGYPPH